MSGGEGSPGSPMPVPTESWALPAAELAARIRRGELRAEDAMSAVLERIRALDVHTNAMAFVDEAGSLAQAREADRAVAAGRDLGPLHGVPVTVKDVVATKGMRTAYGSRLFADNVPASEPEAVARLRRAGAIVIGKSTTPEFAHKILTDSPLQGVTRNPWDLERSPGGSSGGAGAAAAMGFAPLHLTTDGGGSSRVPAACCGVVGLKPTAGAIPNEATQDVFGLQVLGVIARTVGDVKLLYECAAGPLSGDPFAAGLAMQDMRMAGDPLRALRGLRVRWFPRMGNRVVHPEVERACVDLLGRMTSAGAIVHEAGDIDWATDSWRIYMRAQQAHRFGHDLPRIRDRLDPSMVDCIEEGLALGAAEMRHAFMERSALFRRVNAVLEDFDVFVSPVVSAPPLRVTHRAGDPLEIGGKPVGSLRECWYNYCVPINASGHPAMAIPCGRTTDGLPIGVQVVAPWRHEPRLIAVAAGIEAIAPWASMWPPLAHDGFPAAHRVDGDA